MAIVLVVATVPAAAQTAGVPVIIGLDGPEYDACGSQGRVVGLDPRGDNFLAVRSGPASDFAKIDEVYSDFTLQLCEKRGQWWGVVYHPSGRSEACGVTSAVPSPQAYRGNCRAGWVYDRYVTVTAG